MLVSASASEAFSMPTATAALPKLWARSMTVLHSGAFILSMPQSVTKVRSSLSSANGRNRGDASGEQGIDIARIGLGWQLRKPARHLLGGLPSFAGEGQALAQYCPVAAIAERGATLDAGARQVQLDRRELERKGAGRPRQSGQHLGLEALDVDLDEGWHPVSRDQ